MCRIDVPWSVLPIFSRVTIHDAEGSCVGHMTNSRVAEAVVEIHNKAINAGKTSSTWIAEMFNKGNDETRRTGGQ